MGLEWRTQFWPTETLPSDQNIKKMYSRKMKKAFDPLLSISFPQLGGAEIVLMGKPASCLYSTENILEGNQSSDPLLPSSTPLFSICSFRNCDLSIPYGWYQWCGPEVVVGKVLTGSTLEGIISEITWHDKLHSQTSQKIKEKMPSQSRGTKKRATLLTATVWYIIVIL